MGVCAPWMPYLEVLVLFQTAFLARVGMQAQDRCTQDLLPQLPQAQAITPISHRQTRRNRSA